MKFILHWQIFHSAVHLLLMLLIEWVKSSGSIVYSNRQGNGSFNLHDIISWVTCSNVYSLCQWSHV